MNLHRDLERSKGVHDSLKTTARHEREPVGLPRTPLNSDKFLRFPICPQASQSSVGGQAFILTSAALRGRDRKKKVKRKGGIRQPKLSQSFHRTNACYIEGRHLESLKVWTNSNGLPHNLGHKQECRQPGRQSVWCAKLQSCSIKVALSKCRDDSNGIKKSSGCPIAVSPVIEVLPTWEYNSAEIFDQILCAIDGCANRQVTAPPPFCLFCPLVLAPSMRHGSTRLQFQQEADIWVKHLVENRSMAWWTKKECRYQRTVGIK